MGQLARLSRGSRFVSQFDPVVLARVQMMPGEQWTYLGSGLGQRETDGMVVLVHRFGRNGTELVLEEDEEFFDPECQTAEDLIEAGVHERLGLSEEEFEARLRDADLF